MTRPCREGQEAERFHREEKRGSLEPRGRKHLIQNRNKNLPTVVRWGILYMKGDFRRFAQK